MATIRRRATSDGTIRWQAIIRKVGFPPRSKCFPSRELAERWATVTEASMITGTFADTREADAALMLDLFSRYRSEVTPTKRGAAAERGRLDRFMRQPIARYSASNLTPQRVAEWRDARLKRVSGSTVNRDLSLLGHVLEVARKEWGIFILVNPVRCVRRPSNNPSRDRRLVGDEESRLLNVCQSGFGDYLCPAVVLSIETAMRRSEIVSLDWRHIDLTKRVARLLVTKNGDKRDVPLSTRAVAALESVKTSRDGQVFRGWTPNAYRLAYVRAVERAGITNLTLHDLRHEAISRLFERGLSLMEVAAISGHKSFAMLKRYTHLRAEDLALKLG